MSLDECATQHAVSREVQDEVAQDIPRQVRRHLVPAVERDPVERSGQLPGNRARHLPVTGASCHTPSECRPDASARGVSQ